MNHLRELYLAEKFPDLAEMKEKRVCILEDHYGSGLKNMLFNEILVRMGFRDVNFVYLISIMESKENKFSGKVDDKAVSFLRMIGVELKRGSKDYTNRQIEELIQRIEEVQDRNLRVK